MALSRLQEIIVASKKNSAELRKLQKAGLIRKIAPRVYTSTLAEQPERIIRRNWYRILSDL